MSATLRPLLCLLTVLSCCAALDAETYQITIQPLPGELPAAGLYTAYVPSGVAKVRALIFHQHGCGPTAGSELPFDKHWQALADKWDAVMIGDDLDDDCGNWYRPTDGSKAMQERAFAFFAAQSGHPEITTAPLCLWGHSGGGDWTSEFVQRFPNQVIAVYARSGGHDPGHPCDGIPIMFSNGFPSSNDFNIDLSGAVAAGRARGALWSWTIDPGGSHDNSNGRYVAIPFFDACLALRLPAPPVGAEAVTLRSVPFTAGFTGLSAKAQINQPGYGAVAPADAAALTDATRSWLPSADVAQRWSQFVSSGNGGQLTGGVTDSTPPESAPTAVAASVSGSSVTLTWQAVADLQSGLKTFFIFRDGAKIGNLGNPFQGHGFHDEPQPRDPAMTFTDSGVTAGTHTYEIAVVDFRDLVGPHSVPIPVLIGASSDSAPPTIAITTPAGGSASSSAASIALAGTAADNVGVVSVVWSSNRGGTGAATGTTTWSIAAVPLRSGTNTITVTAFDAANHATSATVVVSVGTTGPVAVAPVITLNPASVTVTVGQTATFNVTATGTPAPTFQWQRGGATIAGATSDHVTTPATVISDNGATFRCVVTNSAGSATSTAATLTVNAVASDSTPPAKPSTPVVGGGGSATPTLSGSAEAGATITVRVDGVVIGTTTATGGHWTLTPTLGAGSHTVQVTATDAAGNVSIPSDAVTFTVASAGGGAGGGGAPPPASSGGNASGCGAGAGISAALLGGLALGLQAWQRRGRGQR